MGKQISRQCGNFLNLIAAAVQAAIVAECSARRGASFTWARSCRQPTWAGILAELEVAPDAACFASREADHPDCQGGERPPCPVDQPSEPATAPSISSPCRLARGDAN